MKRFLLMLALLAAVPPLRAQNDDALPALVELLGQSDDPQFQLDLLKGMGDGLKGRRGVAMPAGWEAVSARLAKSPNPQVRELAQSLSLTFGSRAALASLRELLADRKAEPTVRQKALAALLAAKDPALPAALQPLLRDAAVRGPALRALAAYDDAKTPAAVLDAYRTLTVAERKDALNTLAARVPFAQALLAAIASGKVPRSDLMADVVRQLRNLKDADVNTQLEKIWGVARESGEDKLKEISKYKAMIASGSAGDPPRGRAVFSRTCLQCHTMFGEGGKIGPDITGSNRADLDYLLQNILDPNAVIPNDYRSSTLETKDDRSITGIVTKQDATAVTIVTPNDTLVIPRGEVKSLTPSEFSMMPEGILQALNAAEVRDLVAYLRGAAQVPLAK